MTKAELLVDLAARDGILMLWGDPSPLRVETPSGGGVDVIWYEQPVIEVIGKVALKKTIPFYVFDEAGPSEAAYYKDAEPQASPAVRPSNLWDWMRDAIDNNVANYEGVRIKAVSERWEMVIFEKLEDDGAGGLEWHTYYIRRGAGAAKEITNHDPSNLQSIVNV